MINYTVSSCHHIRKDLTKIYRNIEFIIKIPITRKPKEKSKKEFKSKPEAKLATEEMERRLCEEYEQIDDSLKECLDTRLK